ncbi:MAG: tetratricopeptide repeat-containing protein [Chitinispirillales bacterium]|nr:tetratricopeptide repeat-containing protein [Chitinispirillales bacterium]
MSFPYISVNIDDDIDSKIEVDFNQPQRKLLAEAIALVNQAGRQRNEFSYMDALLSLRKALIIREKILGDEHPDVAVVYNNMALVYSAQGDYDKALEFYLKAFKIELAVLTDKHPYTINTYDNLKSVFLKTGKMKTALTTGLRPK